MLVQKLKNSEPLSSELAGYIFSEVNRLNALVARFQPYAGPDPGPLTLIEHYPAAESLPGDGEHLDLVHVSNRRPQWRRVWPTPPANPAHDAFDAWMTACGHVITDTRPGHEVGQAPS